MTQAKFRTYNCKYFSLYLSYSFVYVFDLCIHVWKPAEVKTLDSLTTRIRSNYESLHMGVPLQYSARLVDTCCCAFSTGKQYFNTEIYEYITCLF